MGLVLSREIGERIIIKTDGKSRTIILKPVEIRGTKVRLFLDAVPEVIIHREEIMTQIFPEEVKIA